MIYGETMQPENGAFFLSLSLTHTDNLFRFLAGRLSGYSGKLERFTQTTLFRWRRYHSNGIGDEGKRSPLAGVSLIIVDRRSFALVAVL